MHGPGREKVSKRRVTIIGLGLIGGSLGMALRQTGRYEVVGHDLDPERSGKARKLGAVDQAHWNLPRALEGAEIVVVATPPGAVRSVFAEIADLVPPGAAVTDTASVKGQILAWADEVLPAGVSFVGGHPMAGKETSGVEAAQADLFAGCTYCLVPAKQAAAEAVELVAQMATDVGARPFYIEADEHDSYVAAVSHLPFLLSASLMSVTSASPAWRDLRQVAASGFRDVTRLASGDPVMHRDICLANRPSLSRWLDAAIADLTAARDLIEAGDGDALEAFFEAARDARDDWLSPGRKDPQPNLPQPRDFLGQMLLGGLANRPKRH